ncbi:MAG: COX15/CtaA family protein [Gammaproteobacteria bacterium]|nr:COX15/CtaA family protein [Gammaproteobacteria bacterium]
MVKHRFISFAAMIAVCFAFVVIGLGVFTRLMDAGLGCPDWPGCYGHWVPVAGSHFVAYKAWAEMIHRYAVSVLSLLIVFIIGNIFFQKKYRTRTNMILSFVLIGLLCYQILLGRWTVTLSLWPIVVTQHLIGGFFILSALWLLVLVNASSARKERYHGIWFVGALLGLILVFLQILLGAWTSTNYASLSCPDFPLCVNGQSLQFHFKEAFQILPIGANYEGGAFSESVRQTIQMLHRIGALVVTLYLFLLSVFGFSQFSHQEKYFYLILGLLILQVCLGMINVIFHLPVFTAVSHTLVAALLLLAMITLVYRFKMEVNRDR